jgi:5-methylcytosine-specific restriction endonuclease McrA
MNRSRHFCSHYGCDKLVTTTYCEEHTPKPKDNRVNSSERGYDWKWHKFSKAYLSRPENQFCKLHISPHCTEIADCVDHIVPLQGKNDPRKYDMSNLQAACNQCNTLKGKQTIRGEWEYGKDDEISQ